MSAPTHPDGRSTTAPAPARALGAPILSASAGSRPRVLLGEEDPITAHVLRHRLERDGMAVEMAPDGPAALRALAAGGVDAALLEANLAGVDGLDVLRRIRAGEAGPERLGVGLILWPGNDGLVARAYDLDADDVVVRPLSLVAVSASVRRLVRRRAS